MLNPLTEFADVTCVRVSRKARLRYRMAYNDRLPPPRLPPPIGAGSTSLYNNTRTLGNAHFRLSVHLSTCLSVCPHVHMSVTGRSTRRRSRIVAKRGGPVEIASPRRTVASDFASTASDGPRRDFFWQPKMRCADVSSRK